MQNQSFLVQVACKETPGDRDEAELFKLVFCLDLIRFECIIHLDGKITFIYKDIPVTPANINQNNHSVKVGLSDALFIWHYGLGFVDIYQYHQIAIKLSFPKSNSQIVFKPLPTCVNASSCHHCFDPDIKFNCKWCAALQRYVTSYGLRHTRM